MTIITRQRSDNFAIIPNAVAEDTRLSFEARGVLVYLLAKPHNWRVIIGDIQKAGKIGRDKVYRILNELKDAGYVEVKILRENNRVVQYDYEVHDLGIPAQLPLPAVPPHPDLFPEIKEPAKLLPEKADTEKPFPEKADGLIRTETKTKTHLQRAARGEEEGFDKLWGSWPPHHLPDSRDTAWKLFAKLSEVDRAKALAGAPHYLKAMICRSKPPRMVTYLRDRIFADFHDGPEIDSDGDFVIRSGSPEWGPWLGDIRRQYGERQVAAAASRKFVVRKTRWPADLPLAHRVTNLAPLLSETVADSRSAGGSLF